MKWISVKERLPDSEGEYLCLSRWATNGFGRLFFHVYYFDGKRWYTPNNLDKVFTHWAKIEPPEEV
jgi:hypothetical protein